MHLHQRKGHSRFFKWSKGGQQKNCLWTDSSVSTAVGVFNLPKQNMCFQDVIRDYCSHSKHFMDVNCWLVVNRALSREVSPPLSSKQRSGRPAGPASGSFLTVEGLLSLGTASLSKVSHHGCAPLGSDRLFERSGLFSVL